MGKIFDFFIYSWLLIFFLHELPCLYFLAISAVFSALMRAIDGIIQDYKLDKAFKFKNISSIELMRLLFCLSISLIFCICKWTGII